MEGSEKPINLQEPTPVPDAAASGLCSPEIEKVNSACEHDCLSDLPLDIESNSPVFTALTSAYQNPDWLIQSANQQSKTSYPNYHPRDFGWSDVEKVATQTPGIFGTEAAANIIALLRGKGRLTGDGFYSALQTIETSKLSNLEQYIVRNCCHATWRASQARNMTRYGKSVNMNFHNLDEGQKEKDSNQARCAAPILAKVIESFATDTYKKTTPSYGDVSINVRNDDPIFEKASILLRNVSLVEGETKKRYERFMKNKQGTNVKYNPIKNVGQIHACESAVNIICALRGKGSFDGKQYIDVLMDILNGDTTPLEQAILQNLSKANWHVGLTYEGAEAIKKQSNKVFAQSSDEDREWDIVEIRWAASFLLAELAKR